MTERQPEGSKWYVVRAISGKEKKGKTIYRI
jgi:hypothetical protein